MTPTFCEHFIRKELRDTFMSYHKCSRNVRTKQNTHALHTSGNQFQKTYLNLENSMIKSNVGALRLMFYFSVHSCLYIHFVAILNVNNQAKLGSPCRSYNYVSNSINFAQNLDNWALVTTTKLYRWSNKNN